MLIYDKKLLNESDIKAIYYHKVKTVRKLSGINVTVPFKKFSNSFY